MSIKWLKSSVLFVRKKMAESGRTMLEMLGVLAVVSLLSIGGIHSYNKAVDSNKSDRVYEDIMVAASAYSNRGTFRTTKGIADISKTKPNQDLTTNNCENQQGTFFVKVAKINENVCRELYQKLSETTVYAPLSIYIGEDNASCTPGNAGRYVLGESDCASISSEDAFTVVYTTSSNVKSPETCTLDSDCNYSVGGTCRRCNASHACEDKSNGCTSSQICQKGGLCVTACDSGLYWDGDSCENCPQHATCSNNQIICEAGYYLSGTSCESCTGNTWSAEGQVECGRCPLGTKANSDHTSCIDLTCGNNEYVSDGECTPCPSCGTCNGKIVTACCTGHVFSGGECVCKTNIAKGDDCDTTCSDTCVSGLVCTEGTCSCPSDTTLPTICSGSVENDGNDCPTSRLVSCTGDKPVCSNNNCICPSNANCSNGSWTCKTNFYLDSGECRSCPASVGYNQACISDCNNCTSGLTCSGGICSCPSTPASAGQVCNTNCPNACASGICTGGICEACPSEVAVGGSCPEGCSDACASGLTCNANHVCECPSNVGVNGACPEGCSTSCASGLTCNANHVCECPSNVGINGSCPEGCSSSCASGLTCSNHVCTCPTSPAAVGAACVATCSNACVANSFCNNSGVCEACTSQTNCVAAGVGEHNCPITKIDCSGLTPVCDVSTGACMAAGDCSGNLLNGHCCPTGQYWDGTDCVSCGEQTSCLITSDTTDSNGCTITPTTCSGATPNCNALMAPAWQLVHQEQHCQKDIVVQMKHLIGTENLVSNVYRKPVV